MGQWDSWSAKQVIKLLEKHDFEFISQNGSHAKYRNTEKTSVIVPVHNNKDLKKGTLLSIIKNSGISKKDWLKD